MFFSELLSNDWICAYEQDLSILSFSPLSERLITVFQNSFVWTQPGFPTQGTKVVFGMSLILFYRMEYCLMVVLNATERAGT